ncbi:hypothetical protein PVAND_016445 [Polypedilum vanderplanki]|uniref:HTH CENPB-type domain-containing protein n=1 Tax=Polypedilum vanderplanki TaxID=319348 RepID=A0A9J6BFL9_POLVA|nr:hypothetical protein PVAND_016445 [Polypedilum vanderplanki]
MSKKSQRNIKIQTISLNDVFNNSKTENSNLENDSDSNEISSQSTLDYFKVKDEPEDYSVVQNIDFQSNLPDRLIKQENEVTFDTKNDETITNESKEPDTSNQPNINESKSSNLKRKPSAAHHQNDPVKRIKTEEFIKIKEEEKELPKKANLFDVNMKIKEEAEEQFIDELENNEEEESSSVNNANCSNSVSNDENFMKEYYVIEYLDEYSNVEKESEFLDNNESSSSIKIQTSVSKKRSSYTLKTKLAVVSSYDRGHSKNRALALSKKYQIPLSTIKKWISNKDEILSANQKPNVYVQTRKVGAGKKLAFPTLENQLRDWINNWNEKGITVNNKHILKKAIELAANLKAEDPVYENFKASVGWLRNFKKRSCLALRDQSTDQTLPENTRESPKTILYDIHAIIKKENIKPQKVLSRQTIKYSTKSA